MLRGFKNFLMQGDLIIIAGWVVALAFSTLIKASTDSIITPLVNATAGGGSAGKGIGWTLNGQRIDLGAFIGGDLQEPAGQGSAPIERVCPALQSSRVGC